MHNQWVVNTRGHSSGPETLAKTSAEGKGKQVVGVSGQQLLKVVHINQGDNCKEVGVRGDCVISCGVQEFIGEGAS